MAAGSGGGRIERPAITVNSRNIRGNDLFHGITAGTMAFTITDMTTVEAGDGASQRWDGKRIC